ncbi:MAG: hybrid sensor histidine kinase/response regulator [Xenococcaceae cyanobacterium MO_188.B32]|nr:hybrid sensor histidine kinase/response regulator [Xenococcaceae cyanobacterium MO_188.B32]
MIDPDIRDQAYQFFIEEAPELLLIIETNLLSLRQERNPSKIHDLMRAAHSIKGGAATVGLDVIKTIAHRLEDIFKALYSETVELDSELESLLLQGYDCLQEPLSKQIAEDKLDEEWALANAEPVLARIEAKLGTALDEADSYMPSSTDLGVDMVLSIFEIDVSQGIDRMAMVLASPQAYDIAIELRTQAEVFSGFADILGLPGFGEIAQTTVAALDACPDRAEQIMRLALADFQQARDLVLAGDRTQGGNPSLELLALTNASTEQPTDILDRESEQVFDSESPENYLQESEPVFDSESPENYILDMSSLDFSQDNVAEELTTDTPSLEELLLGVEAISEPDTTDTATNEEPFVVDATEALSLESLVTNASTDSDILDTSWQEIPTQPNQEIISAEIVGQENDLVPFSLDFSATSIPEQSSPPKPKQKAKKDSSRNSKKTNSNRNLKVRVDLERLERMNNYVGELVIDRNSISLQQEQLQTTLRKLRQRLEQFQYLTGEFQDMSDKMILNPINTPLPPANNDSSSLNQLATYDTSAQFDSLEMDQYGQMHSLLQGVVEEMMQLEEAVEDVFLYARQSNKTIKHQQQTLGKLRDELMWARMLPLGEVLNRFPRGIRDLSLKYDKPVNLHLKGTEVLIDKGILEKLYDPLLHLLRNAFDHGIESPEIRRSQGKPEEGNIEIHAYHRGNQTIIEVSDDGKGLDINKIAQRVIERGLLAPDKLTVTTKDELLNFIFEPGFSTAEKVSELSGRGVGLDVVLSQLQEVKGTVKVDSTPGQGTTFILSLPLTLTISKLLVCAVGATAVALPSESIVEIVFPQGNQIKQMGKQRYLSWREDMVPVYRIADLLEYGYPISEELKCKDFVNSSTSENSALPMLILEGEKQSFALEIENFGKEQEMVIKPFNRTIAPPPYTYGCTILGDGSLVPVIDGASLLTYVREQNKISTNKTGTGHQHNSFKASVETIQAPMVLVVDDSAMMRRTLAITLRKVGYRVIQARDGLEAIELLQQNSQVELIVSDLEMPNLNGFEFLNQLRQNPDLSMIPVVMLTSRSNDKHRQLATHLGAAAYMTKPYIEQEFLAVLKEITSQSTTPKLSTV